MQSNLHGSLYRELFLDRILQMRDKRRVDCFHDLDPHFRPVDAVKQTYPRAKEDRRECNRELIDQTRIEELENGIGAPGMRISRSPTTLRA